MAKMELKKPKFTVITVCKNAEKTIRRAMQSVLSQTYKPLEYIIVDGLSSDGTMKIVEEQRDQVARIFHEKDNGIYDAMNKGIDHGSGDYYLFLNADDYLFNETALERVYRKISGTNSLADIFFGQVLIFDEVSGKSNVWQAAEATPFSMFRSALPHPATVYSGGAFARNGLFDLNFPIAADYEWAVRAIMRNHLRFQRIDTLISVFSKGGLSTKPETHQQIMDEKKRIRHRHYSSKQRLYYNARWRTRKTLGLG